MPRFFFNVRNHIDTEDFEGRDLPDLAAATQEAHKDIADIIRARFETIGSWSHWSIEICNEDGLQLRIVPFSVTGSE